MIVDHSEDEKRRPLRTELTLYRGKSTAESTIGTLFWLDAAGVEHWECYILEQAKPIPAGRYEVRLNHSPKFERTLPILLDVPGYSGIRFHTGNTAKDTQGCLLPGQERLENRVERSTVALDVLFAKLQLSPGPRWLTIKDAP